MNHINHHESNNNIPAWKVLQERRQDPFHFMISRPQPPGSTSPPLPEVDLARKNSRVVIPSKRAAQNRAAQKAFRQRRDQYIKELETKANEVKETQLELNQLRQENSQLRERVSELERQIVALTGGQEKQEQSLSIPTITSEQETTPKDLSTGFQNDENEPLANNHTIAVQNYPQFAPPMVNIGFWQGGHHNTVDFEFAFDPFLDNEFGLTNNEFVPSEDNEQVLDDLFAVLQTRQRPQIPTVPSSLDELDNN